MNRWMRAAAVVALVTGLTGIGSGAKAEPEGDTFAANIAIDVVVVGTPPPGTQFVVDHPNNADDQTTVDAATTGDAPPDIFVPSGTIYRDVFVSDAGGAAAITFDCEMDPAGLPANPSSCAGTDVGDVHHGTGHADIFFNGGAPAQANVTITLYFASCAGQPATVVLEAGEKPTVGDDVIVGTPDGDVVRAKAGNDLICTLGWGDHVNGGPGNDRVFTGPGQDSVYAGAGVDRVYGGGQGDQLYGLTGNDALYGQAGNDTLDGMEGTDVCDGGAGGDIGRSGCETRRNFP